MPLIAPLHSLPLQILPQKWCHGLLLGLAFVLLSKAASAGNGLLWFEDGRPNVEARQAAEILVRAHGDGLVPGDYDAEALHRTIDQASESGVNASAATHLDEQLTAAMQRYLADLHFGRLDPRQIHENFNVPSTDRFDPAAYLRAAVLEHRLPEAVWLVAPPIPLYTQLRSVLAQYRELAGHLAWQRPLPPYSGRKLEAGDAYVGVALLAERLIALGDLPRGTAVPDRYQGVVVDGVKAFQERHGLEADGVIGKATLANLNVPPADRLRQIEINLERLRWTPLQQGRRMIVINIPEFMLRAYNIQDGRGDVQASMKVIVGKALNTRTPVFEEDMRFIEFSPYWNVPPSIARAETVPKLRRDAQYFEQQGFEFVGRDGRVLTALTPGNLNAVLRGDLRIRQRPGPKNALGDIKFIFPNNEHIYLHHTPTPQLFSRVRRDFSHGCIRVEEPVALAKFVLQGDPEWSEERILDAMGKGASSILRLREPVRVLIAYGTAIVKNDGRVFFFPDLYGHDELLDKALRLRQAMGSASHLPGAGAQ